MHQSELPKRLARQRELNKYGGEGVDQHAEVEEDESDSDESTEYEDCSDMSSIAYENDIADDFGDEVSGAEACTVSAAPRDLEVNGSQGPHIAGAQAESSKMEALVASLRDARVRASARRNAVTVGVARLGKNKE